MVLSIHTGTSTEIVPGIGGGGNTQPTQHPENTSLNILRRLEPLRRLSSPSKRSSSPANAGVRELKSLSPTSAGINEPKVEGSRAAHTTTTRRLLREVRRSGSVQSVLQEVGSYQHRTWRVN